MGITGVELIYRLQNTVRLLITYRPGVDAYRFYHATAVGGPWNVAIVPDALNLASILPPTRGKIVFEFYPSTLAWDNTVKHFLKMAPIVGGAPQALEGPLVVPVKYEFAKNPKDTVSFGFNKAEQRFIPLAVDPDGVLL
jgi:hypothetical protein